MVVFGSYEMLPMPPERQLAGGCGRVFLCLALEDVTLVPNLHTVRNRMSFNTQIVLISQDGDSCIATLRVKQPSCTCVCILLLMKRCVSNFGSQQDPPG